MAVNEISPPGTPLLTTRGTISPEWYRFFVSLRRGASDAATGEVQTDAGSGLEGGGFVADGIDLSIAENGVTNAMIREGMPCSVIGRFQNSTGDVADITAPDDGRVLTREGGMLAFRTSMDGISVGTTTAAPVVRTGELSLTDSASASTATVTHSVPITVNGTTYYILLSNTP